MNQFVDRLRDSSAGKAILDRWSQFSYLSSASKIRYGGYAAVLTLLVVAGVWRLATLGGPAVEDATAKKAELIRQQAAVEPPPATHADDRPTYTGPEPKSVKGGGESPELSGGLV